MKFVPYAEIKPSLGTQIAKLGIIPHSKLFKRIVKNIKAQTNLHIRDIEKSLLKYIRKYKDHIENETPVEKKVFKDWSIVSNFTETKIMNYVAQSINEYISRLINSVKQSHPWDDNMAIHYTPPRSVKRRSTKKFNHMLNQITIKVDVAEASPSTTSTKKMKQVTIMCFSNLSLTLTGCNETQYGQMAVDALVKCFPSFEILKPPYVVMTTIHYPLNIPMDLADAAIYIQKHVPRARSIYQPDTSSHLTIIYTMGDNSDCKFIIRESGKIMLSSRLPPEEIRPAYNTVIGTIVEYINSQK
jgi:hypothetical protein